MCLAIMFIAMEGIWSAGTANWGTAFRHRVVAWGLLVAVGGHFFYQAEETQDSSALKKAKITRSAVRAMRRRRQGVQERSVESQNDRSKE